MLRVLSTLCLISIIISVHIGANLGSNGYHIADMLLCGLAGFLTAVYGELRVEMFLGKK